MNWTKWQEFVAVISFLTFSIIACLKLADSSSMPDSIKLFDFYGIVMMLALLTGLGFAIYATVNGFMAHEETQKYEAVIGHILEEMPFAFRDEDEMLQFCVENLRLLQQTSFKKMVLHFLGKNLAKWELDSLIMYCHKNSHLVSPEELDILRDSRRKQYPTTALEMFQSIPNFRVSHPDTISAICLTLYHYLLLEGFNCDLHPLAKNLVAYLHSKELTRADISDQIGLIEEKLSTHYEPALRHNFSTERMFELFKKMHAINT